jgi:hypothetical protein
MRTALTALLLLVSGAAIANPPYGPQGGTISSGVTLAYVGPGNLVSGATAWWGLRGYSSSYSTGSNPAALIRRASDGTTATINILSIGQFDVATAQTFCSGTTCSIQTLYDQTGNGYNLTQATAADQPALTFNCFGFAPCMTFTGSSSQALVNSSFPELSQPYSVSAVVERTANFTSEQDFWGALSAGVFGSLAGFYAMTNSMVAYAGSAAMDWNPIADSVLHSAVFVFNAASSYLYVDGSSLAASTNPGSAGTYSAVAMGGSYNQSTNYLTGYVAEMGVWPSGLNSTQANNIVANQQQNWR